MTKFVCLGAKTYGYLIDDGREDKKAKGTKMCVIKGKFKFENYKNCLQAIQRDNKISYLEKNKTDIDSLEKDHKEFFKKNSKFILKTQKRFKSKRHNAFIEKINKIVLSSNYDKRVQSNGSIETYAYGTIKDLKI